MDILEHDVRAGSSTFRRKITKGRLNGRVEGAAHAKRRRASIELAHPPIKFRPDQTQSGNLAGVAGALGLLDCHAELALLLFEGGVTDGGLFSFVSLVHVAYEESLRVYAPRTLPPTHFRSAQPERWRHGLSFAACEGTRV